MDKIPYEIRGPLLTLSNVGYTYPGSDTPVLRNINVEIRNIVRPGSGIQQGQVVAVLGPGGSGKTTLFSLMAGLKEPTEGKVLIGGPGEPVRAGMVGVVAQDFPLMPFLTVYENVLLGAQQGGLKRKEAPGQTMGLLERYGMKEHRNKYPAELSGGQKQRTAIMQQRACSGHYILMDEPFSGQDVLKKRQVCHTIQEFATTDELNTILVVTHDVPAAVLVADHILCMGKEEGRPGTTIRHILDLAEMGLAWHPELPRTSEFRRLVTYIEEDVFPALDSGAEIHPL